MSEVLPADNELRPRSKVLWMEQVCGRFEAAWKAGQRPRLEDYLADVPEPDYSALLRELLGLELDYRHQTGEQPRPEEYRPRFLEHTGPIDSVFQETALRIPQASQQTPLPSPEGTTPLPSAEAPAAEVAAQPLHPLWIGKYQVIERLGGGGQADVFRAKHPKLPGHDVVIKWAKESLPAPIQQMLITEGGILARLEDPGLVRIYDVDVHEGRPFIVMEYVAGRTLQQQIKEGLPRPREAAALVARLALPCTGYISKEFAIAT
jgi:hypothetical protein